MKRRAPLPRARAEALKALLLALDATLDRAARIAADPVEFPRRFTDPADQEVAGLLASALAYGRADLFKPVLARLFAQLGEHPARAVETFARAPDPGALAWFKYRFNRPADLAALLAAIGHLRLAHGSLGRRFSELFTAAGGDAAALRPSLASFARELREAPPAMALLAGRGPRGLRHLLPDPAGPGAAKRWQLYLRWMVRGPDGVDLGVWPAVPAGALLVPLDTHLLRVSRRLGLVGRAAPSWRTAESLTAALRLVDPSDPVRFDFALCHLGMSGACPARLTAAHCAACPLVSACRHATSRAAPRPRPGRGTARARTR